jgi:hypothetical protein
LRSQQALATSLLSYDIIVVHCGTHADLWLTATFSLLWNLAASFDEAVREQNLSLFLRHNRRLSLALTGACGLLSSYDIIVVHCGTHADLWLTATFPLLWDLAGSFDEAVRDQKLSLDSCGIVADLLRDHCRFSFAPTGACDFIVVLIFIVAYPLRWSSCSNSWDQTIIYCARLCVLSCGIIAGLNRRLVG